MCHWRRLLVWQGGRGDGRVVCLARSSPAHPPHSLYTHTPLALFKATHSCGNVSIVTPWTLFGQQLGAGIWAEACVRIWACACVAASGSCTEESAHAELEALSFLPHPGDKLREIWGTRDGKCWQLQVLRLKDTPPTHPHTHTYISARTHQFISLHSYFLIPPPSQWRRQSDSSCQRALVLPYNKRWKGVWERAGAQSPPCPCLSPCLGCIREAESPFSIPHPVAHEAPICKNTSNLPKLGYIHFHISSLLLLWYPLVEALTLTQPGGISILATKPKYICS